MQHELLTLLKAFCNHFMYKQTEWKRLCFFDCYLLYATCVELERDSNLSNILPKVTLVPISNCTPTVIICTGIYYTALQILISHVHACMHIPY